MNDVADSHSNTSDEKNAEGIIDYYLVFEYILSARPDCSGCKSAGQINSKKKKYSTASLPSLLSHSPFTADIHTVTCRFISLDNTKNALHNNTGR